MQSEFNYAIKLHTHNEMKKRIRFFSCDIDSFFGSHIHNQLLYHTVFLFFFFVRLLLNYYRYFPSVVLDLMSISIHLDKHYVKL